MFLNFFHYLMPLLVHLLESTTTLSRSNYFTTIYIYNFVNFSLGILFCSSIIIFSYVYLLGFSFGILNLILPNDSKYSHNILLHFLSLGGLLWFPISIFYLYYSINIFSYFSAIIKNCLYLSHASNKVFLDFYH